MKELTLDQRETLSQLDSEAWNAITALCDVVIDRLGQQVLNSKVEPNKEQSIIQEKCRFEGAVALVAAIKSTKESLREKRPSPKTGRK